MKFYTLNQLSSEQKVKVLEIEGGWRLRQKLNQMGIHVNDDLILKRESHFGGPVLISIHGIDVALGHGMARKIRVKLYDPEE